MAKIDDFAHHLPRQLSGGMRQRVSICRALIHEPSILLMDEPFSALDAITRDEMGVELLRIWQANRKTVLFVTHSIREAAFLSDRVVVMGRRPATIVEEITIDLPRPRKIGLTEANPSITTSAAAQGDRGQPCSVTHANQHRSRLADRDFDAARRCGRPSCAGLTSAASSCRRHRKSSSR